MNFSLAYPVVAVFGKFDPINTFFYTSKLNRRFSIIIINVPITKLIKSIVHKKLS